ncbi:MAG: hypothetical protein WCK06_10130 [Actinomycetota bacterium]
MISEVCFPGDRRVWKFGGGALALLLLVMLVYLAVPRQAFTGSNSVAARDAIVVVGSGQRFCAFGQRIPAGTGRIQFSFDTREASTPTVALTVRSKRFGLSRGKLEASATQGLRKAAVAIPTTAAAPSSALATICVKPIGGTIFVWGRSQVPGNEVPPLLDGAPVNGRPAFWFLPPSSASQSSILSQLPEVFTRASLFRPGVIGPWSYWLLLLLVFPLLAYGCLRLLANAESQLRRHIPLVLWIGLITFVHAGAWAIITPAFQTPDEPEHYAYAEYFAQTGKSVERVPEKLALYSSDEVVGLEETLTLSIIERGDVKAPWLAEQQQAWQKRNDAKPSPAKDNGGGFHPATSTHTPAYYALLTPAYTATESSSVFTRLTAMRLTSALMGALTAMFTFLLVLEFFAGQRAFAVAGGLFVGLQPMFGFISGGVNNDDGVNALCALLVLLVVRALKRGLTWRLSVGIGLTLAAAPLMKGTAYALYPAVAIALFAYLIKRHSLRDISRFAGIAAGFAAVFLAWRYASPLLDRPTFTTPGGGTPGVGFGATSEPLAYLSWMWQNLFPFKLPFMTDFTLVKWPLYEIYVHRGFGAFGWYAIYFQEWVYVVILAVLGALGLLAARLAWVRRSALSVYWPESLFVLLVPICVIFGVGAAYFTLVGLPLDGIGEQGRYGFTAISAAAVIGVAGCLGAGKRRSLPLAAVLVGALLGLVLASWMLVLSSYYT